MNRGLAGEGLADNRVWLVKTHFPERYGKENFFAQRCILCVRNPMDAISSLYHMVATVSHHLSIKDEDFFDHIDVWSEFIE